MKKFDIKKVLILVLALIMMFALVACNSDASTDDGSSDDSTSKTNSDKKTDDGGNKGGKTPSKQEDDEDDGTVATAEYFQILWDSAASLGNAKSFEATDDIQLALGLDLAIGLDEEEVIDLGIEASIILDRNEGEYTAAKVKVYDLTNDNDNNWLTLYYFLDDPYVIYIDWSYGDNAASFKVNADLGINDDFAGIISEALEADLLGENSVNDIINIIVNKMGEGWTLDKLVESALDLLGIQMSDILDLVGLLLTDVSEEDLENEGILLLLKELGPLVFGDECAYDKATSKYTASIDMDLVGGLLGMLGLGDEVNKVIDGLLDNLSTADLVFGVDANGGIDGFNINLGVDLDEDAEKSISVGIGINKFEFKNIGTMKADDAAKALDFEEENYSEYFEFDMVGSIEAKGNAVVLNGLTAVDGATIDKTLAVDLDGKYTAEFKGYVDLYNKENNATALQLVIGYNGSDILSAEYKAQTAQWGQIILTVDDSVEFADTEASIIEVIAENVFPALTTLLVASDDVTLQDAGLALANALYTQSFADRNAFFEAYESEEVAFEYDANFKGVVMQQISLVDLLQSLLGTLDAGEAEEEAVIKGEDGYVTYIVNIYKVLQLVESIITRSDDAVQIKVDNLAKEVLTIFATGQGPTNAEALVYGNEAKNIAGILSLVNGLLGTEFEAADIDAAINNVCAGSAWIAEDGKTLLNLVAMGISATIKDQPYSDVKITCGDASIEIIGYTDIVAADEAPEYDEVARPDGISNYFDAANQVVTIGEADIWCVLSVAREAE